jgi:signal transduction histidine kinase
VPEHALLWQLPYLLAVAIALGIAIHAWRRNREAGARAQAAYTRLAESEARHRSLLEKANEAIKERNHAAREIAQAREQLRTLSHSLVRLQEEERAAIARELHDEIGQALSYQILNLTVLQRDAQTAGSTNVAARATEALRIAETLLDSMHRLVLRLRPSVLDHLGLLPALQQLIDARSDPALKLSLETVGLPTHARFTPEIETALYRVVQEALTNVTRHASARRVDILLERPPDATRGDRLILLIEDDGIGFDPETAMRSSRLGLLGMRERIEALGGTLTLESSCGQGTTILVEIPYAQTCPGYTYTDR